MPGVCLWKRSNEASDDHSESLRDQTGDHLRAIPLLGPSGKVTDEPRCCLTKNLTYPALAHVIEAVMGARKEAPGLGAAFGISHCGADLQTTHSRRDGFLQCIWADPNSVGMELTAAVTSAWSPLQDTSWEG